MFYPRRGQRALRDSPKLGGFAKGISSDEIVDIGEKFGGGVPLLGDPKTALSKCELS